MLQELAKEVNLDIVNSSNELILFLARTLIDDELAPLLEEYRICRLPPQCSRGKTVWRTRLSEAGSSDPSMGTRIVLSTTIPQGK